MPRRYFYDTEFSEHPQKLELISIGVVSETGQEFYEVFNDFDEHACNPWVQANVLPKLPIHPKRKNSATIKARLLEYLKPSKDDPIELWGYYSAYDHVALCWLFGPMVNLPPGMPMLTLDIEQYRQTLQYPEQSLPPQPKNQHNALADARWVREAWCELERYVNCTPGMNHGPSVSSEG
jgi:hypothetical protein